MSTQTPDGGGLPPVGATPPPGTATGRPNGFFHQLRSIGVYRSEERWIGGVAGGLAARFGLDPLLVRGLFLVTLLLGGFGLVIYAVAWALLPEQRDGRIHLEGFVVGHPDIALLGALGMFVAGVGRGTWNNWPLDVPGWIQGLFWFGATILVIVLVTSMLSHRRPAPRPMAAPYPVPASGPSAPYASPAAPFTGASAPFRGPAAGSSYSVPPAAYGMQSGPRPMSTPAPPAPAWSTPAPAPAWGAPAPAPAPYHYAPAPTSVLPAQPGRPPRRGPGATTVGVTVALSLFVVAGALVAQRAGWLDHSTGATAAALIVLIFGAAIIVSGLRGRRGGVLSLLAVVATIVALPVAVTTHDGINPWVVDRAGVHVTQTQGTTTVTDRSTAANGFRVGFGDATLDLTGVPLEASNRLVVPIDISAGNLVVVVPPGAQVAAQVDIGAGQATWKVGGDDTSAGGLGRRDTFGVAPDKATLWLQIHAGAGNVTIQEGTR